MRKLLASATLVVVGMISGLSTPAVASSSSPSGGAIAQTALTYLGRPYRTAGTTPELGFNDIGFVRYVYGQSGLALHIGVTKRAYTSLLARGSRIAMGDLQPGDILFFKNTLWPGLSHVGIYMGDGKFVHAEWFNIGVTTASLRNDARDGDYWAGHYYAATRPWATR